MSRSLAFALLAAAFLAPGAEAARMTVAAGHYPWHEYKNSYERAWTACYPNETADQVWKKFESRLGVWNWGEGWSEERFRSLPAGTDLEIPPSECELRDKDLEIANLKSQKATLEASNQKFEKDNEALRKDVERLMKERFIYNWRTWVLLALAVISIAVAAWSLLRRPRTVLVREKIRIGSRDYDAEDVRHLQEQAADHERMRTKLAMYETIVARDYYEYELKRGFRRASTPGITVHLPRTDADHVRLPWIPLPVPIADLDRIFAEAGPDELRQIDVEIERASPGATRRIFT